MIPRELIGVIGLFIALGVSETSPTDDSIYYTAIGVLLFVCCAIPHIDWRQFNSEVNDNE